VHPDGVGEIYLVAVAENTAGSGLGRALVEHGVEYLTTKRECSEVIVYRSQDNETARRLYEGVGFVQDRVDRRLEIAV
jgi:mycothiol synthase